MVNNGENILVEFDYNNIALLDPNKIIDENGKAKERLVRHEELVMYVNLECKVIPRTKLLLGSSNADNLRTISVSSMNFLNPGGKTFLDNSYTDEITGKDTLKGQGVNQQKINKVSTPNKSGDFYLTQTTKSGGKSVATDNGLLGMKSVSVRQGLDFQPMVIIKLEDVKGRALFESGNDSPYSAFFNLPYPQFYLTIKGYYGKAIKLPLMLQDFNSSYNSTTGNFDIELTLYTYKYTVIGDISMTSILAVPHMYRSNVETTTKKTQGQLIATDDKKTDTVSYGYQKIKEVYSEYKSKGLIDKNFPELTLVQMLINLDSFIERILEKYTDQNLDALTYVSKYQKDLTEYRGEIYDYNGASDDTKSWFNKYIDTENYFFLANETITSFIQNKSKCYLLKKEFSSPDKRQLALTELNSLITLYNTKLDTNPTLGKNGKYDININGNITTTPSEITNKININIFTATTEEINPDIIDYELTYKAQKKLDYVDENNPDFISFKNDFLKTYGTRSEADLGSDGNPVLVLKYFKFEGKTTFLDYITEMVKQTKVKKDEIETKITEALSETIKSNKSGLGFIPTIRNVLAVIFANGEAFLRLLDDVHTKAFDKRDSVIRKAPIFNAATRAANPDVREEKSKAIVYPWPDFIIQTNGEKGEEKFQSKYPGDPSVISETQAYQYDYWPEVEFVEEFIAGLTLRQNLPKKEPTGNDVKDSRRLSLNAIEYPATNVIFDNKEEVKYFFEIYERLMVYSFYSKMNRSKNSNMDFQKIMKVTANAEKTNILESLVGDYPFLKEKLKNYNLNASNFLTILKQFSNQGVGESWQNYIRGIFNTPYLKNEIDNSFKISSLTDNKIEVMGASIQADDVNSTIVLEDIEKIKEYITGSTKSNDYDFTDTIPFAYKPWRKKYMSGDSDLSPFASVFSSSIPNSIKYFSTSKVLHYNTSYKTITNFDYPDIISPPENEPRPFSGYNFKKLTLPTKLRSEPELNISQLKDFYDNRLYKYNTQLPTEGELIYLLSPGFLPRQQTISILNTPFFTNSIQEGIEKFRNFEQNPYVVPAYLFINSLPIATLRERFTLYSPQSPDPTQQTTDDTEYLDYVFATLKKYGAIHKLPFPWILKIGSIWHRYKKWAQTGEDILETSWNRFNYLDNFDPPASSLTKTYSLVINQNQNVDITLNKITPVGSQNYQQMNTGFYPKTINDFNVFYQGVKLYTGYTSVDIQSGITKGLNLVNVSDTNITVNFSGDPSNQNTYTQLNAWSAYVLTPDKKDCFLLPSHGAVINQVFDECFKNDELKKQISNNKSIYDGSVRNFWGAPIYGYLDAGQLVKPNPDEYMKQIFGGLKKQQNFSLNSRQVYSKMSEIFSVFEKDILDMFEEKFLNFCGSKYDYVDKNNASTDIEKIYGNFQLLFTNLMKVEAPGSGDTPTEIVNKLQSRQISKFTTTINGFMNYSMMIKYGNPSNFNKNLFYTFSNKDITDPFIFEKYSVVTPNALPITGGTQTLAGSKISYPDAWSTLIQYVGFSEISGVEYTNTGSTIFDFFIDFDIAFTPENIRACSPIIKMYSTQKLLNANLNANEFKNLMDSYISDSIDFIDKSLNDTMTQVRNGIPNIKINREKLKTPTIDGEQTRLDLWGTFKAINDKWISGNDFKSKTLFEDVLLLDRASRDLGNKVIVDIYKLRGLFYGPNKEITIDEKSKSNMMVYVNSILSTNNFNPMYIPAYINFYGVQNVSAKQIPKPEGSLELANTLFGTFLNVDYRESSTKMVCFYGGKPSVHLDTQGIIEGFKNDSFNIARASDNPLVENQVGKKDWATSNKVVGFNVDFGPQNQGVFQNFSVSQKNSTPTAESLQILTEMANQAGNRGVSTQSLSLYNLYKLRSYDCNVTMLGDALIQPMMYFNLRYVPMFSGPYLITEVNHEINQGSFLTTFKGTRQPMAGLPTEIDFLQTLKTNLIQPILDKKVQERVEAEKLNNNTIDIKNKIVSDNSGTKEVKNFLECPPNSKYSNYSKFDDAIVKTPLSYKEVKTKIEQLLTDAGIGPPKFNKLKYSIFSKIFVESSDGYNMVGLSNNFIGLDIKSDWAQLGESYFTKESYFCVQKPNQVMPYLVFDDIEQNISILRDKWNKSSINTDISVDNNETQIAKFISLNSSPKKIDDSEWNKLTSNEKDSIVKKVKEAIETYDKIE
jgi:hypothetical protein